MRLVDVVLASVLLGLGLGLLQTGFPRARAADSTEIAAKDCHQSACHRLTWLRTPMMRRAGHIE
jgi:hypothetical protein